MDPDFDKQVLFDSIHSWRAARGADKRARRKEVLKNVAVILDKEGDREAALSFRELIQSV